MELSIALAVAFVFNAIFAFFTHGNYGRIDLLITLTHAEGHLEQLLFGRINEALHCKLPCSLMFNKHEPGPTAW